MTEVETQIQKVIEVSKKYKNICIIINTFVDLFIAPGNSHVEPTTDVKLIKGGLYGKIGQSNLWVGYIVAPGYIRVSNEEISDFREENKWSPEIPIADVDKIDQLMSMKAFW